ncbi:MAG: protein-glutamate O-methyltransferase CheR [Pseudobdellovibrionaceae bacterium]
MSSVDSLEQKLILEGIFLKYGYDFRKYAESSFSRRLQNIFKKFEFQDGFDFLKKVYNDPELFEKILPFLTISTTELFRDPLVFKTIRESLVPILKTYPRLNIWVAGCSTGEEVYSLAIILLEEGLYSRSNIFATDINPRALEMAREGRYSLSTFQSYVHNYTASGGTQSPSDYYTVKKGFGHFQNELKENILFEEHNLATDHVFREMHLILCRNVLIYFNRTLEDRVLRLFHDSLVYHGFLVLGSKETTRFSSLHRSYRVFDPKHKIFQKENLAWGKEGLHAN